MKTAIRGFLLTAIVSLTLLAASAHFSTADKHGKCDSKDCVCKDCSTCCMKGHACDCGKCECCTCCCQ